MPLTEEIRLKIFGSPDSTVSLHNQLSDWDFRLPVVIIQFRSRPSVDTHVYICIYTNTHRDNVVYWKTKRKIKDDLQYEHTFIHTRTYIGDVSRSGSCFFGTTMCMRISVLACCSVLQRVAACCRRQNKLRQI